jgi:hypothetical protein
VSVNRPPVIFLAFNRPDHARRALDALAQASGAADCDVLAYLDGPRNEGERALCDEVCRVVSQPRGFRSVRTFRSRDNKGLYRAVTEAVSSVLSDCPEAIVLEDDIVVARDFLDYMTHYLDEFRADSRVGCIHAYALPAQGLPEYYFLRGADCWGWATWTDRWRLFDSSAADLLRRLDEANLLWPFMKTHGSSSLGLLCDRVEGKIQSWAILWHASLFLEGRLTLHPGNSRVQNIGNDGSGTHSLASGVFDSHLVEPTSAETDFPAVSAIEDSIAAKLTSLFMDTGRSSGILAIVLSRASRVMTFLRARRLLSRLPATLVERPS